MALEIAVDKSGKPLDVGSGVGRAIDILQGSDDPETQAAALRLLASHGQTKEAPKAAEAAAKLLASNKPEVIAEAARTLGCLGNSATKFVDHVAAVLRWQDRSVRLASVEALARFGKSAARHASKLVKVATDPDVNDEELKIAAITAIAKVGGDVAQVPKVASLLADQSPHVQGAACVALTSLGPHGEDRAADIALKLNDESTRGAAAAAMSRLPTGCIEPHVKALVSKGLSDADPQTRAAALQALGKVQASRVLSDGVNLILELLQHQQPGVRACAAMCLAQVGEEARPHADAVARLLEDQEEDVSWLPLQLGGSQGREPVSRRKPRCAALLALGGMCAQDHTEAAVELLEDSDWEVRHSATEAMRGLCSSDDSELIERVAALLDDDTYPVRAQACSVLGALLATNQADRLSEMLNDKSETVRFEAADALGKMGESAATYAYEVANLLLSDGSARVRGAAAKALGKMGESGRPYASLVAVFIQDMDISSAREACIALGCMGDSGRAYAEEIEQMKQVRPELAGAANEALALLGVKAGPPKALEASGGKAMAMPAVVKAALQATS